MAAYSLRNDLGSKAAVRYGARSYQLNPRLELLADVHQFDEALGKARGASGDQLVQWLTRAVELYRGPLLAEAAWDWLDPVRLDYRSRYVSAALQLADVLASVDSGRSDAYAERALAEAPETDIAYECLIENARRRGDRNAVRRTVNRYVQAAAHHGFVVNPRVVDQIRRAS
jgi:two-component SAPR family response regulator